MKDGYLHGNTLGTGKTAYYVLDAALNHAFDASLEWRAQVIQNDLEAVEISAVSGRYLWHFNLAHDGVELALDGKWKLVAPMNTRDALHTYRADIPAGNSAFKLYVDNVLVYLGDAWVINASSPPSVYWGDATVQGGNSDVLWDYVTLSQEAARRADLRVPVESYQVCALYDQTKAATLGSTIPIKLQLCGASGKNLSSPDITLTVSDLTMVSATAPGDVVAVGNANPDGAFRYDASLAGYVFNLSTRGLGTGTYNLNFTAGGDSDAHKVQFEVK